MMTGREFDLRLKVKHLMKKYAFNWAPSGRQMYHDSGRGYFLINWIGTLDVDLQAEWYRSENYLRQTPELPQILENYDPEHETVFAIWNGYHGEIVVVKFS
jgi:hypothetical protein